MVHRGQVTRRSGHRGRPSLLLASVLEAREQDRLAKAQLAAARARRRALALPPDDQHEWLRVPQTATRLGVSQRRVYQLAQAGRLPYTLVGDLRWFRADHVRIAANAREFMAEAQQA